jgi:serine/threonine protein kinase/WD40 repeat protein/tetratricopeptide (TPR) repeat protein
MNDSSDDRNPVEVLAEESLERQRRGERPTIGEYAERYPDLAADIRDLFPALVKMEQVRPQGGDATGVYVQPNGPQSQRLEKLGDYRILREVGRGGMGIVYEAEQESLGRHVALKVLPSHALLDARHLQRFQREAKAAARLHHTNIVPVFGVGEASGLHYYVMQFIQGLGLDEVLSELRRLKRALPPPVPEPAGADSAGREFSARSVAQGLLTGDFGPPATPADGDVAPPAPSSSGVHLPGQAEGSTLSESGRQYWQSVAHVGIQVADALAYATSQGVLHRDIKPSNLLLDSRGTVWVTDFGLAKAADAEDLTHSGDVVGTIRYLAPERFEGRADLRGDLYALGLTLYEMLTLRPAFSEPDRAKLIQLVTTTEPPPPRKVNPAVPRDLETIVLKAVARDVRHRYQTAADLAADLQRFVDDRPILARRVSVRERFWRWCRRNPLLAAATGLAAAALLAVTSVSLLFARAQADFAASQEETNRRQEKTNRELEKTLADLGRESANLAIERSRALVDKNQLRPAMLWLARGLERAPAEDAELRHSLRNHLAALRYHLPELVAILPKQGDAHYLTFGGGGRVIFTATVFPRGIEVRRWETATGEPRGEPLRLVRAGAESPFRIAPKGTRLDEADRRAGLVRIAFHPHDQTFLVWSSSRPIQFLAPGRRTRQGAGAKPGPAVIQRWDAATGRPVGRPFRMPHAVGEVVWSPHGKSFWTESWDGWERLKTLPEGDPADFAARFARLRTLKVNFQCWDATSGDPIGKGAVQPFSSGLLAVSPDGRKALLSNPLRFGTPPPERVAPRSGLLLWDIAGGKALDLEHLETQRVGRYVTAAFSHDGKTVRALTAPGRPEVHLWDTATGKRLGKAVSLDAAVRVSPARPPAFARGLFTQGRPFGPATTPFRSLIPRVGLPARFGPGGEYLLAGTTNLREARINNGATGQAEATVLAHRGVITNLAFSPDGGQVLVAGEDGRGDVGDVRLWRLPAGSQLQPLFPFYAGAPLTFLGTLSRHAHVSPDGKCFLTLRDGQVRLWDLGTGRAAGPPLPLKATARRAEFSRDGTTLLVVTQDAKSQDRWFQLWQVRTGRPAGPPVLCERDNPFELIGRPPVASTGRRGGRTRSGPGAAGRPSRGGAFPTVLGSEGPWRPTSANPVVELSPDGRTLLTGGGRPRLWDGITGRPGGKPLTPRIIRFLAFSPNGKTALTVGSRGNEPDRPPSTDLELWDIPAGRAKGKPVTFPGLVTSVAFAPNGKTFVTLGTLGPGLRRQVGLWDAGSGKPLGPPLPHADGASFVLYHPGGRLLLTGGEHEARLWEVPSGKPHGEPMTLDNPLQAAAFSPDGRMLMTECTGSVQQFWDVRTGGSIGLKLTGAGPASGLSYSPDGRVILSDCLQGAPRFTDAFNPVPEDPAAAVAWVEATLGLRLAAEGTVQGLDVGTWRRRREEARRASPRPWAGRRLLSMHVKHASAALKSNDPFTARWHLAHELKENPGDSLALILRTRAHVELRQLSEAGADFKAALAADRDLALVWFQSFAQDSRAPVGKSNPVETWFLKELTAVQGDNASLWRRFATSLWMSRDYRAAIAAYTRVVALEPEDHFSWFQCAPLFLLDGDRAGHRRWCEAMLKRFANTKDVMVMERTAKACLLCPEPPGDPALLTKLIDRALKAGTEHFYFKYFQATKGLAELRAGRYPSAIDWFRKGLTDRNSLQDAVTYSLLALAEGKGGNRAAARKALDRVKGNYPQMFPSFDIDRLIYELIHREAVELLKKSVEKAGG